VDERRSCRGSNVTATDQAELDRVLGALAAADWSTVLDGVASAAAWLQSATPGDVGIRAVTERLVVLASHLKWEVRRAVAQAAAKTLRGEFEPVLARLATDDNARVRQAAEAASLRRRDWANASALGKQHEDHINATLDDIEARFGVRGRVAVKRASEQIANTFARELYHEVVKLLSPLATSADRLVTRLGEAGTSREELVQDASRMKDRVTRLRSVLDAMRAYSALPKLSFSEESIQEVIDESVTLISDGRRQGPPIRVDVVDGLRADVCRGRLVQALTNILANAVEAYEGLATATPIAVTAIAEDERVVIKVRDHGCGMSEEARADATVLFSTSKPTGTGFGLPLAVKIVESEHDGRLDRDTRGRVGLARSARHASRGSDAYGRHPPRARRLKRATRGHPDRV
jgi:nitrogen fixation/metabolism regulation signal transduction histidine kinase